MQSKASLNFSALSEAKNFQLSPWTFGAVALFALSVPVSLFLGEVAVGIALAACALCVLYEILRNKKWAEKKRQTLAAFASSNGFEYSEPNRFISVDHTGTLFEHGFGQKSSNHITGKISGLDFDLFDFNYSDKQGKNRQNYFIEVAHIKLKRHLPHIVIDSKLQNVLPIVFENSQRVDLEGDFSKYFGTYAPDKHGITLLAIIAPDVMETLMNVAIKCDIEIIDDNLYFYFSRPQQGTPDYQAIFKAVQEVLREIQTKLNDANVLLYDPNSKLNAKIVNSSKRLKQDKWRGAIIGSVFFVLLIVQTLLGISRDVAPLPDTWNDVWMILTAIVLFGPLLAVTYFAYRQLKLEYSYHRRKR